MATGERMAIAFVGSVVPEEMCTRLKACFVSGNRFQLQVIEALGQTSGTCLEVISVLPLPSFPKQRTLFAHSGRVRTGKGDQIEIQLAPFVNIPVLKQVTMGLAVMIKLSMWLRREAGRPRYVLLYNVFPPLALGALAACRLFGGKAVAIVADLPHNMNFDFRGVGGFLRRVNFAVERWSLKQFAGLVPLSQAIVDDLNPGRPALVMDGGIALTPNPDASSRQIPWKSTMMEPRDDTSPSPMGRGKITLTPDPSPTGRGEDAVQHVCMYSGALTPVNGIELLVRAFGCITDPSYRLWISGRGELEGMVKQAAERDGRITYLGFLTDGQVLNYQQQATVLINPRPSHLLIQRYTFPSKLRDYMLSGRPVITTALPSIPADYSDFVYMIRDETPEKVADTIRWVCSKDEAALASFGKRARDFVLETRNWNRQAQRIIQFLLGL